MTPFGKELHTRIQTMFAPKEQLKAASFGEAPLGSGAERVIQSEAPVVPEAPPAAPAAAPQHPTSPIMGAVADLGPAPVRPAPESAPGTVSKPTIVAPEVAQPIPDDMADVPQSIRDRLPTAPAPPPTPAPPAPQVQATPEVAYTGMYQSQQERAAALREAIRNIPAFGGQGFRFNAL